MTRHDTLDDATSGDAMPNLCYVAHYANGRKESISGSPRYGEDSTKLISNILKLMLMISQSHAYDFPKSCL
jgi:hypothetical protein